MKNTFSFALSLIVAGALAFGSVGPIAAQEAGQASPGVTPPLRPGGYSDSVFIPADESGWEYRFLKTTGVPHTDFFLPLETPLLLAAPQNATVSYRLEFRYNGISTGPVVYTIDRLSPDAPYPAIAPGTYDAPILLGSDTESSGPVDERVYVLLQRNDETSFQPLDETGLRIPGTPGRIVDYEVLMYAEDGVGNRSAVSRWPFRIDRRSEVPPPERIIVSPVAGEFANEQLLVISDSSLTDVEVQLTGPNGSERFSYSGERNVPGAGEFEAIVSAVRRDDGTRIEETVSWTQGTETLSGPGSGRYFQTITVFPQFEEGTPLFNLEDRSVSLNDDALIQPLRLRPGADSMTTVVLRLRRSNDPRSREWRYTYIIDGRSAAPAEMITYKDLVVLNALSDTSTEYRTIAAGGEETSYRPYEGPFSLAALPADTTALDVRTRYVRGTWGVEERYPLQPMETLSISTGALVVEQAGDTVEITRTSSDRSDAAGTIFLYDDAAVDRTPLFAGTFNRRLVWALPGGLQTEIYPRFEIGSFDFNRIEVDESAFTTSPTTPRLVSTAPPSPPTITVRRRTVILESDNPIMARVDSDAFEEVSTGRIRLQGESGRIVERRVEAYTYAEGEVSPRIVEYVTIDDRPIEFPPLYSGETPVQPYEPEIPGDMKRAGGFSVPNESFVTNTEDLRFSILPPHDDVEVYYEVGFGRPPKTPTEASYRTTDDIVLSVPENRGTERVYIRGRARFIGSNEWSEEAHYLIVVDTEPPAPPVVETPDSTLVETSQRVTVSMRPPEEDDVTIWFRTRPDRPFRPYTEPLSIVPNRERSVVIEAFSEDLGGNRAYLQSPITIRTARNEETRPRFTLNGLPVTDSQALISRDTLLGARSDTIEDGGDIEWRVYENSASQRPGFERFSEEVLLSVPDRGSDSRTYVAEARIVGDRQRTAPIARLRIIADVSASPLPSPEIIRGPQGTTGTLLFPGTSDVTIFMAGVGEGDGFREVRGTVPWRIPEGVDRISLRYFSIDGDGRRSATEEISITRSRSITPPVATGVDDGGVYRMAQVVEFSMEEGIVRYSITTDGSDPPPIHRRSAPAEGPLRFAPPLGEDRTYSLRYALFLPDGSKSAERSLRFRIDRRSPSAPELIGATDEQFFPETTQVRLVSPDDSDLFVRMYRIDATGRDSDLPLPTFQRYQREEIALIGRSGEITSYRIEAYSVDAAGNRSQSIATWTVHVDQAVVYVSRPPDAPEVEEGDGTRERPYTDLNSAFERLLESERKTLFLAAGDYNVDASLFNRTGEGVPDMAIVGGFDGETWEVGDEPTTITSSSVARLNLTGTQRLQRINFAPTIESVVVDAVSVTLSSFTGGSQANLVLRGGTVSLRNVTIGSVLVPESASTAPTTIRIDGVNLQTYLLSIARGEITASDSRIGAVAVYKGAIAEITDSRIGAIDGVPALESPVRSVVEEIVFVDGGIVELNGTGVYGRQRRTIKPMIAVVNEGSVSLEDSTVHGSADDSVPLLLIRGVDSDIAMHRSVLVGSGGIYSYGVASRRGSIVIEDSVISLDGGSEQTAIIVADSGLHLSGSATVNRSDGRTIVRALQSSGRSSSHRIEDTLMVLIEDAPEDPRLDFGTTSALDRANVRDTRTVAFTLGEGEIVDIRSSGIVGWSSVIDERRSGVWSARGGRRGDAQRYRDSASPIEMERVHPAVVQVPVWPLTGEQRAAIIEALRRSVPSQVLP